MFLTLARSTTLPRRREAPQTVGQAATPWNPSIRHTRANSPGGVGRQGHPQATCHKPAARSETHGRRLSGPGECHRRSLGTQWCEGGDVQMNPAITTGTAPYMGGSRTRDHHHRFYHSNLYGSGLAMLSLDTADQRG